MRIDVRSFHRIATAGAVAIAMIAMATSPGHAQQAKKGKKASADSTYSIREKCIAKAQAAYPDTGLGTATVMTQRTGVYADCAKSAGIRP